MNLLFFAMRCQQDNPIYHHLALPKNKCFHRHPRLKCVDFQQQCLQFWYSKFIIKIKNQKLKKKKICLKLKNLEIRQRQRNFHRFLSSSFRKTHLSSCFVPESHNCIFKQNKRMLRCTTDILDFH